MDGNIVAADLKPFGQSQAGSTLLSGEINVKNVAAFVAMKVAMLAHIRAIAHRGPVQIDFIDEIAFDEKIEAIINGRHRDFRHGPLGAHENLLGGRMVPLLHEHAINPLTLRGKAKAFRGQALDRFCL